MAIRRNRRYYTTPSRRIKIFPGVYINVGQSGASLSFGNKNAKATVGKTGTNYTVGIPGTGLSYRKKVSNKDKAGESANRWSWLITVVVAILGIFTSKKTSNQSKKTVANKKKTAVTKKTSTS